MLGGKGRKMNEVLYLLLIVSLIQLFSSSVELFIARIAFRSLSGILF